MVTIYFAVFNNRALGIRFHIHPPAMLNNMAVTSGVISVGIPNGDDIFIH